MPLPFDVVSTLRNNRKENRRAVIQDKTELSAVLGNEDNVRHVPGKNGNEFYVRLLGDSENGNATYQPSTTAFVRGNFFDYAGSPVVCKHNRNGDLVIIGPDEIQVAQAGDWLSISSLNSGDKQSKFLNLDNVRRAMSRMVSRGYKASTLVSVAQFIYDHYGNYITFNGTPLQADKIDLASYIPGTGEHTLVQLWLDTFNNSIEVIAGTPKDLTVKFVQADYDEVWDGSIRFQDWLPLQAYDLKVSPSGLETITQKDLGRDHRQFLNMPDELGNANTLTVNMRIRADRQQLIHGDLTIPAGYDLVIEAGGEVVVGTNPPKFTGVYLDYAKFNDNPGTIPNEEGVVSWNADDLALDIHTGIGPVLQAGQEFWIVIYNNTGAQINNLDVLRPVGAAVVGGIIYPTFELAQSDDHATAEGTLVVATMDIPDATVGITTRSGKVRGVNTSGLTAGLTAYLSPTVPGGLTNTRPAFPDYNISLGAALNSDASDGEFIVSVTRDVFDTTLNFWNGTFREAFDFLITSTGGVITGTLTPTNGHPDMTAIFSDGLYTLDTTPGATIVLTAGADDETPQSNYVYIPQSTKVLTLATGGWPTTVEHIRIAEVLLVTAATTALEGGARRNQNWNDEIQNTQTDQGHLSHIGEWIRAQPASYVRNTGTAATLTGTTANVYIASAAGDIMQFHRGTFPPQDMTQYTIDAVSVGSKTFTISGDGDLSTTFTDNKLIHVHDSTGNDGHYHIVSSVWSDPDFIITVEETPASAVADGTIGDFIIVINDSVTALLKSTNLNDLTLDSTGATLNNRWFSIIIWGVRNKSNELSYMACNLPSGSYTSEANAIADALNYSDYTIPDDYNGVGFLIARFTMRKSSSTFTYNGGTAYVDLRGQFPSTAAGGGGGGSGGGSMSSFTVAADSGTPETIVDSDALSILGGAGVSTVVSATDTVTINRDGLIFVEEKTFVSAATTSSFTGLTGTDMYYIEMDIYNSAGSPSQYEVRINGDANSSDYFIQQLQGAGSTASAVSVANAANYGYCINGETTLITGELQLVNGFFMAKNTQFFRAASDSGGFLHRAIAKNTGGVGSISQIDIIASITNAIGIGSVLRLWKATA